MSAVSDLADLRQGTIAALGRIIAAHPPQAGRLACAVIHLRNIRKVRGLLGDQGAAVYRRAVRSQLETIPPDPSLVIDGNDDHIILMLPGVMNAGHAELVAQKIERVLREANDVDAQQAGTEFTLGMALFPDHAEDPAQLLARAELALVAADGADTHWALFDHGLFNALSHSWQFDRELREAIQNNSFTMYYQPQVGLRDGRLHGVEALIRWEHPARGMIQPSLFIPLAERTGLINRLTDGVLRQVMQDVQALRAMAIPSISINLSAMDLEDPELATRVSHQLAIWAVPSKAITFEITESALLEGSETTRRQLEQLHAMGCGLSIDDFGTGYSSLANFRTIPASEIKIDGSFIADLANDRVNRDIVAIALELGRRFGLKTVAEGVETEPTARALIELGCEIGQGYYFARPLRLSHLQEWCATWSGRLPDSGGQDTGESP